MHHKRKKSRNQRAGCKMCKPWKANGVSKESVQGESHSDHIRRSVANNDLKENTLIEKYDFIQEDYWDDFSHSLDDMFAFHERIEKVKELRELQKIRESKDKK